MNGQTMNPPRHIVVMAAAKLIDKALEDSKPEDAGAVFYAVLAESAGELTEEFWTEVMKLKGKPCGVPGDCETLRGPLLETLDKLRKNYHRCRAAEAGEKELSA